uniref:Uncharacterized protein n=1 Tax=Nelumbo nucifera TaxID=4432 RepID=A0A822Z385_NELNU|nr:TPA_asm: hypothetical protein HUJ06_013805 [Nelumbo nucifera]
MSILDMSKNYFYERFLETLLHFEFIPSTGMTKSYLVVFRLGKSVYIKPKKK